MKKWIFWFFSCVFNSQIIHQYSFRPVFASFDILRSDIHAIVALVGRTIVQLKPAKHCVVFVGALEVRLWTSLIEQILEHGWRIWGRIAKIDERWLKHYRRRTNYCWGTWTGYGEWPILGIWDVVSVAVWVWFVMVLQFPNPRNVLMLANRSELEKWGSFSKRCLQWDRLMWTDSGHQNSTNSFWPPPVFG